MARRALIALLAAVACSALLVPSAFAAEGTVSGKVTDAESGLGIPNAQVCFEALGGVELGICQYVEPDGTYSLKLTAHEYVVEFWDPAEGFATQYWHDKEFFEEADPIKVTSGGSLSEVNAAMTPASRIDGTATASGSAVAGILICAFPTGRVEAAECAETDTQGKYSIEGLQPSEYQVEFTAGESGLELADQWWEGKATRAEAKSLLLPANGGAIEINANLLPPAPPLKPVTTPIPTITMPAPIATKPALKCKKHFRKKTIHGKARCVRVKKKPKGHHRR